MSDAASPRIHAPDIYPNGKSALRVGLGLRQDRRKYLLAQIDDLHLTDLANARRLVAEHGADFRYVPGWGWMVWTGKRWQRDETGEVMRRAKQIPALFRRDARRMFQRGRQDAAKVLAHAQRSEARARLEAMVALAQTEPEVVARADQFDADPWLLNVLNGTIDLRTGKVRHHRREDLITKLAPVEYRSRARCRRFEAFLNQIMDDRPEMVAFLQRALGYALTGSTREQVFFVLYGTGANGKTTLLETIRHGLGDYAAQADPSAFLVRNPDAIRNDIARLAGDRFVSAVEVGEGKALDEALVKQVTGGDRVTARFLHHEFFEYVPRFKVFLATNHKPTIRGADPGIWRRIRLVPFQVTIPPEAQDRDLLRKLQKEASGILRWLVKGCLAWQREGLGEPPEVLAATADYRTEMDTLAPFFVERCVLVGSVEVSAKDLYREYVAWAEEAGERKPLSRRAFGLRLRERGFAKEHRRDGIWWRGIGLRGTAAQTDLSLVPPDHPSDAPSAPPDDGRRVFILAMGRELGFPTLRDGQGEVIAAGGEAYRAFCSSTAPGHETLLDRAIAALRALEEVS